MAHNEPAKQDSSATGAPRRKRKWLRRCVIACAIAIIVVAAAPTLIGTFGRERIASMVSESLNGSLTLGDLALGWTSGLSAEDVKIRIGDEREPAVHVQSLTVDPAIMQIVTGSRIRAAIDLYGVTVRLKRRDGVLDLSRLVKPAPTEEKAAEPLPELDLRLLIRDITVIYEDDALAGGPRVEKIERLEISLASGEPLRIHLLGANGVDAQATLDLLEDGLVLPSGKMGATGSIKAPSIDLARYAELASFWVTGLEGQLEIDQQFTFEKGRLTARGHAALADVNAALVPGGQAQAIQGLRIENDVFLAEGGAGPEGTCVLTLSDARVSPPGDALGPLGVQSARADLQLSPDGGVVWRSLSVKADGLTLTGAGSLRISDGGPASEGTIEATGDMQRIAALVPGLPALQGGLTSNVAYILTEDGTLDVKGQTRITDFVATGLGEGIPDIRESEVVLDHDLLAGPELFQPRAVALQGSFGSLSLSGELRPGKDDAAPSGAVRLETSARLDQVSALARTWLPVTLAGSLQGSADLSGSEQGYTLALHMTGEDVAVAGELLPNGPLDLGTVTLDATGASDTTGNNLDIEDIHLVTDPVGLKGGGTVQRSETGIAGQGHLAVRGDVARLATLYPGLPDLQGQLASDSDFDLAADGTLDLKGQTRVTDLVATGLGDGIPDIREKLVVLDHDLIAGPRLVEPRNVALEGSFGKLGLTGKLTLGKDGAPPVGSVRLTSNAKLDQISALASAWLPVALRGSLEGTVDVAGTAEGYALTLDLEGKDVVVSGDTLLQGPLDLGTLTLDAEGEANTDGTSLDLRTLALRSKPLDLDAALNVAQDATTGLRITASGTGRADVVALQRAFVDREPADLGGPAALEYDLDYARDGVVIRKAALRAPVVEAGASGTLTLSGPDGPRGTLDLDLFGELAQLAALAPEPLPLDLAGTSTVVGKVTLGDSIDFASTFTAENLVVSGGPLGAERFTAPNLTTTLAGSFQQAKRTLQLDTFEAKSAPLDLSITKPLRIEGLGGEALPALATALAGRVDLGVLPIRLIGLPEGSTLAGVATLSGTATYDGKQPGGTAVIELRNLAMTQPGGAALAGNLDLTCHASPQGEFGLDATGSGLRITPPVAGAKPVSAGLTAKIAGTRNEASGSWELTTLDVSSGGLSAKGSGSYVPDGPLRIDFDATLAFKELNETWLPLIDPTAKGEGTGHLAVDVSIPAGAERREVAATGSWDASMKQLLVSGFDLSDLVMKGRLANGVGDITEGSAKLNGGTVTLLGQVDLRGADPKWTGGVRAKDVQVDEDVQPAIAKVIPVFAGLGVELTAKVGSTIDMAGTGTASETVKKTLSGGGNVSLSEGSLKGGPIIGVLGTLVGLPPRFDFKPFQADFSVKDGIVRQDGAMLSSEKLDIRMAGTTGLDGSLDYKLGLRLKGPVTQEWQRFTRMLSPDGFLPIRLKGTTADPTIVPLDPEDLLGNLLGGLLPGGLGGPPAGEGEKKPGGLGGLLGGLGGLFPPKPKPEDKPEDKP